jgi:hypothetical protein
MRSLDVAALATEFPIGVPTGGARDLGRRTSRQAWQVDTNEGAFFVKRVDVGDWQEALGRGREFEQAAFAAGITMPAPVTPYRPAFGVAAQVGNLGLCRVHAWVDAEPVGVRDISTWLGTTLAAMHRIEPIDQAQPNP